MGKPYSMDLRERAVAAVLRGGLSRHKSAAQFGVGISTVINWVRRFQDPGSVAPRPDGRVHKPKAIAGLSIRSFLARRVREGGFTLHAGSCANWPSAASRSITDQYGTSSTPRNSASKKTVVAAERDRPDIARRRVQWTTRQSQIDPERLVFIDETWTKTNMAPLRGWARRGKRLVAKGSLWPLENSDLPRRASP